MSTIPWGQIYKEGNHSGHKIADADIESLCASCGDFPPIKHCRHGILWELSEARVLTASVFYFLSQALEPKHICLPTQGQCVEGFLEQHSALIYVPGEDNGTVCLQFLFVINTLSACGLPHSHFVRLGPRKLHLCQAVLAVLGHYERAHYCSSGKFWYFNIGLRRCLLQRQGSCILDWKHILSLLLQGAAWDLGWKWSNR